MSTGAPQYDAAPYLENEKAHRRRVADAIDRHNQGKFNCNLDVTLRASQTTTVVTDPRLTAFSAVQWMPMSASAATAAAALWAVPSLNGTLTLTHASNAAADQKFRLSIFG